MSLQKVNCFSSSFVCYKKLDLNVFRSFLMKSLLLKGTHYVLHRFDFFYNIETFCKSVCFVLLPSPPLTINNSLWIDSSRYDRREEHKRLRGEVYNIVLLNVGHLILFLYMFRPFVVVFSVNVSYYEVQWLVLP